MSHTGTIAHHRVPHIRGPWLDRIAVAAAGFALGAAAVFLVDLGGTEVKVDQTRAVTETVASPEAKVTGMVFDDFLRLNTTELGSWSPQTQAYVVPAAAAVDPFTYLNTTAYDGLVPLASAAAIVSENPVDPDFLYWNTTALDDLVPSVEAQSQDLGNATEEFLYWNTTSLEYPPTAYAQQPNGPR